MASRKPLSIVSKFDADFARAMAENPRAVHWPVPQSLIDHGLACLAYGPAGDYPLRMGFITARGQAWVEDVKTGGKIGSGLFLHWCGLFRESWEGI